MKKVIQPVKGTRDFYPEQMAIRVWLYNTMREVADQLGNEACFETHTTELIGYGEAAENALPIWLMDSPNARKAAGKREYDEITDEFLQRFPN